MLDRELILCDLVERCDRQRWGNACSSSGSYAARAASLGLEVYNVYSGSVFAWFSNKLYCFNGKIYEEAD